MKKSLLSIILFFILLPTASRTQIDTVKIIHLYIQDACVNGSTAQQCIYEVFDAANNPVSVVSYSPSSGGITTLRFMYDSSAAPYFLGVDETCFAAHGTFIDNYYFEIGGFYQSSVQIINNEVVCNYNVMIDLCSPVIPTEPNRFFSLEVDYVNCGDALVMCPAMLFKDGIQIVPSLEGLSGVNYWNHQYDINASYTLRYEETCLDSIGIQLPRYVYQVYPEYSFTNGMGMNYYQTFNVVCETISDTLIDIDTCANLYATVNPYRGYYQNTLNQISLSWRNTFSTSKNVVITVEIPQGVMVNASMNGYTYTQTGNQLVLTTMLPANSIFYDILNLNVPGSISNGTLHTYSINISSAEAFECDTSDNSDYLNMIVGNSYDPNNKTVSLPEVIAPDIQDEFMYTIHFQNTGTAPAQDIYIDDTLSSYLDWSTFELLRSSHPVEVLNVGNGVKRFVFEGIWLPDSTSNLTESQGYVSFKIKEKSTNGEGTEILNTAYIYFDHNPAIITNTTYNINSSDQLGVNGQDENTIVVYPNPAFSSLKVVSAVNMEIIEILSITGEQCLKIQGGESSKIISVHHLEPGIYFLKITAGTKESIQRFVKQ